MKKRIFLAILPGPEIKEKILSYQEKHQEIGLRLITKKNLHVTILPPWEMKDITKLKKEITLALKNSTIPPKINLEFKEINLGPKLENPFLLWARIRDNELLTNLKVTLEKSLKSAKIPIKIEDRTFQPHITIARFKKSQKEDLKNQKDKLFRKIDWQFKSNSLVIMQSHLGEKQADYQVLDEISFT